MSRSGYSDDYGDDFPGQLDLYRANVDRAFWSKSGRARLAELLAALDAMPVKELADEVFIETRPADRGRPGAKMCALGVWAATFHPASAERLFTHSEPDAHEMADALESYGWPKLVVQDVVYWNDDREEGRTVVRVQGPRTREDTDAAKWRGDRTHGPVVYVLEETDAERWQRMRNTVASKLREIAEADARVAAWKASHPFTTPSRGGVGLL